MEIDQVGSGVTLSAKVTCVTSPASRAIPTSANGVSIGAVLGSASKTSRACSTLLWAMRRSRIRAGVRAAAGVEAATRSVHNKTILH